MFVQSHGRVTQFSERRLANWNEARECEIEQSGISTVIHAACGHSLVDGNGNGSRAGSPQGSRSTGSTHCAEPRIAVWHDLLRETCKGDIT